MKILRQDGNSSEGSEFLRGTHSLFPAAVPLSSVFLVGLLLGLGVRNLREQEPGLSLGRLRHLVGGH